METFAEIYCAEVDHDSGANQLGYVLPVDADRYVKPLRMLPDVLNAATVERVVPTPMRQLRSRGGFLSTHRYTVAMWQWAALAASRREMRSAGGAVVRGA